MGNCDETHATSEADFIAELVWANFLATNLAIGAALRLSFALGMQYEAWLGDNRAPGYPTSDWRPGCKREASCP